MVRFLDSLERNRSECYCSFIFLLYSDIFDNDNTMILTYVCWATYLYFTYIFVYISFLIIIEKFAVHFFLEIWQIHVK